MPPLEIFAPRCAAEPPQEPLPYGRWAATLSQHFLDACRELDTEGEDVGKPGDVDWFPDRTYNGRTFVPAVTRTEEGYELYGHVSFVPGGDQSAPSDFYAHVDFTAETADRNPEWQLDLSDDVIGTWRGESGKVSAVTLVWGTPLKPGGAIATAELGPTTVDQCVLVEDRFTLIAPDDYRGDFLEVRLFGAKGNAVAVESLYDDDGEDEDDDADEADGSTAAPSASDSGK